MRNEASKKAKGEILFFMDADAVMKKNCIEEIVKCFKKYEADAVSCIPVAPPRKRSSILNYLLGLTYEDAIRNMREGFVDVAASTGFGIKKSVFLKSGGFIENFKAGIGEDWFLSADMVRKGYKIWHSNKVKIYHYTASSLKGYLKKQFFHAWYRIYHFKKFRRVRDSYTRFSMLVQSGLFLLLFLSPIWIYILISLNVSYYFYMFFFILLLTFFWSLPQCLNYFKRTKNIEVFLILPLSFIVSFIRSLAVIKGVWDFYIRNKVK
jgi:GT2 family glycosyltransferase